MTPRERIQVIANLPVTEEYYASAQISPATCAALRELDQLLADVTNWLLNSDYEDSRAELISRLAQAGYGEK